MFTPSKRLVKTLSIRVVGLKNRLRNGPAYENGKKFKKLGNFIGLVKTLLIRVAEISVAEIKYQTQQGFQN